jgi:hypothetical protein
MHILIYYKLSIFKKLGKIQFGSLAHLGQGVTLITQLKKMAGLSPTQIIK